MPGFTIQRPYTMPPRALRKSCEELAARLSSDHGVRCHWENNHCLVFKGSGVNGQLDFADRELALTVKLGLLAAPFEKPLRARIVDYLDRHIY
jgi:putative polyhydroxyalkanoate system protein